MGVISEQMTFTPSKLEDIKMSLSEVKKKNANHVNLKLFIDNTWAKDGGKRQPANKALTTGLERKHQGLQDKEEKNGERFPCLL